MTLSNGRPAELAESFRMSYLLAIDHLNEDLDSEDATFRFRAHPICDVAQSVITVYRCTKELEELAPVGIVGAVYSDMTRRMALLTTELRLLQCSPTASAPDLSDKGTYPFFFRAISADSAVAETAVAVLLHFHWWRAAVVHTTDRYAAGLVERLIAATQRVEGGSMSFSYFTLAPNFHSTLPPAVLSTLEREITFGIRSSQVKIVILVLSESDLEVIAVWMWRSGLIGPDYAWIGFDVMTLWAQPRQLQLMDSGLLPARDAYSNLFAISQRVETTSRTARLQASARERFNTTLGTSYDYLTYDCVIAIGSAVQAVLRQNRSLAASDLVGTRSAEVAVQLRDAAFNLEFVGASGVVRFENAGERLPAFSISQWNAQGFFEEVGVHNMSGIGNSSIVFTRPANFSGATELADSSSCERGTEFNASLSFAARQDICQPCQLGRYGQTRGTCTTCPPGFKCDDDVNGTREPRACEPGRFSDEGAHECSVCARGSYSSKPAASQCFQCPRGQFQDVPGASLCKMCPVGFFQSESGSTRCSACPMTQSTETAASASWRNCGCPANFRWAADLGRCLACQPGLLDCSRFNATPRVMPGYYLEEGAPRDVGHIELFRCSVAEWCPGEERPGDPICTETREGLNCGRCVHGFFEAGQRCHRCAGLHPYLYLLGALALFLATGLMLHLGVNQQNEATDRQGHLFLSITAGTTLAVLQRLGIIGRLGLSWPQRVKGALAISTKVFFSDLPVLRPPCTLPSSLFTMYLARLCAPLFFVLCCALWWGLSRLLRRCLSQHLPDLSLFHIVNTCGLCVSALYIFTVMGTLSLVDCYENPNGRRVIREFSFTLCSGPDFMSALPLFVLGVLVYIGGIVGVTLYALWIAPSRYESSGGFRVMIQFLVNKFRPEKFWFGLITMLSSFLMALVTVIFPDSKLWQLTCMQIIASLQLSAHCFHLPYPQKSLNVMVNLQYTALVIVLFLGSYFYQPSPSLPSPTAEVACVVLGVLVLMVGLPFCAVGWGLHRCWGIRPCSWAGLRTQATADATMNVDAGANLDVDSQFRCIRSSCERILAEADEFRHFLRGSTSYVERERALRLFRLLSDVEGRMCASGRRTHTSRLVLLAPSATSELEGAHKEPSLTERDETLASL